MKSCISNPPFNLAWQIPPFAQLQPRFADSAVPPKNNANYAFILSALEMVDGKAVAILPSSVLESKFKEENAIRKHLVEKNLIEAVIACPDKMFEKTGIATCILVLNKKKTTAQVCFLDMRQTYETEERQQRGQFGGASHENRVYSKAVKIFSEEQMQKALDAIANASNETGFCRTVPQQCIRENGYTLNPSRYIELPEEKVQHRPYGDMVDDLNRITKEKNAVKLTVNVTLAKTLGLYDTFLLLQQSEENHKQMQENLAFLDKKIEAESFMTVTKKAGELRFENTSKDGVSTILLSILQMWKQHIMYLNNEENRVLLELRDVLLPDLMSGKISIPDTLDKPHSICYHFSIRLQEVREWRRQRCGFRKGCMKSLKQRQGAEE